VNTPLTSVAEVPKVDLPDLDELADEFEAPPPWVEDVAGAIGATFSTAGDASDPLGEDRAPLGEVPLDPDDHDVDVPADEDPDHDDGDPDALLEDIAGEFNLMEEDLNGPPSTTTLTSTWAEVAELRPRWVVELAEALLRNNHLRRDLVEKAEDRMLRAVPAEHRDPALIGAAWGFAGHPSRRPETLAWLRRVRNDTVAVLHRGSAFQHHVPNAHPEGMKGWRPKGGALIVNEVVAGSASFGHPALMEHTPLKVVYYALKTWQMNQSIVLDVEDDTDAGGLVWPKPSFFDATAGSGTVGDYLGVVHGCEGTSIDLTPTSERVALTDLRHLGFPRSAQDVVWLPRFDSRDKWKPALSAGPVDLVFFDPPSRGRPTHADLYAGARPEDDLGGLHRDDYISACSAFVQMAMQILRPRGYIVYPVRHGVRDRQRIVEDNRIIIDLKVAFGPSVTVERQVPIKYRKRVPQVSLGVERVPATLLMLRMST
jgi:hypothetical protein